MSNNPPRLNDVFDGAPGPEINVSDEDRDRD